MRLIKAVVSTVVFGIAFLSVPQIASADSIHASSHASLGSNGVNLAFTINSIPSDLADAPSQWYYTNTANVAGNPCYYNGNMNLVIPCGEIHPNIRICSMLNTGANPTDSIFCNVPHLIAQTGSTVTGATYLSGRFSTTFQGQGYFDDNFNIVPDTGYYYAVSVGTPISTCGTSITNCTYWVEYYSAVEGFKPYTGTGSYTAVPYIPYWTPAQGGTTPTPTDTSAEGLAFGQIYNFFHQKFVDSIFGQFVPIYQDFFSLCADTGLDLALSNINCWENVNPHTTWVNIGSLVPADNQYGADRNASLACKGFPITLPGDSLVNHKIKVYNPATGNYTDGEYLNSQAVRNKINLSPDKVVYPFNACDGDIGYIADKIIRPLFSGVIVIGFLFLLINFMSSFFGMSTGLASTLMGRNSTGKVSGSNSSGGEINHQAGQSQADNDLADWYADQVKSGKAPRGDHDTPKKKLGRWIS